MRSMLVLCTFLVPATPSLAAVLSDSDLELMTLSTVSEFNVMALRSLASFVGSSRETDLLLSASGRVEKDSGRVDLTSSYNGLSATFEAFATFQDDGDLLYTINGTGQTDDHEVTYAATAVWQYSEILEGFEELDFEFSSFYDPKSLISAMIEDDDEEPPPPPKKRKWWWWLVNAVEVVGGAVLGGVEGAVELVSVSNLIEKAVDTPEPPSKPEKPERPPKPTKPSYYPSPTKPTDLVIGVIHDPFSSPRGIDIFGKYRQITITGRYEGDDENYAAELVAAPVPLPSSFWLILLALAGLSLMQLRWRGNGPLLFRGRESVA